MKYFAALFLAALPHAAHAQDIVIADFEGETYNAWQATGTAFGAAPARGTLPNQMAVSNFEGRGLANSFNGGDGAVGTLTSPPFKIERPFLSFLIGGGAHEGRTALNLLLADDKVVRTATGPNARPGGTEALQRRGWDVRNLMGRVVRLQIVDSATGGWGHVNVDHIMQTNNKPPLARQLRANVSRTLPIRGRWLSFPVQNGAPRRNVTVSANGQEVRRFEVEIADGLDDSQPDFWAPLDVAEWRGKELSVSVDVLPEGSRALEVLASADAFPGQDALYREALRPQFHFSAQRGWLNDPNGMAFYNGEYHLFFQHLPFSWNGDSGAKYWSQAVSRDLVHWREVGVTLRPDRFGGMWSGSGVVDWKNTSGLGAPGKPPFVLLYTAAGDPFVQALASSTDGRNFAKLPAPILGNVTGGNRDPKVIWHEPTKRWIMVLYVEKDRKHTVHFYTSPNLREWTLASVTEGQPNSSFLYECPDLFPLALDGDPKQEKWVLTGADSAYAVGRFDGKTFTPETTPLPGHRGRGFYAAQTFSDEPKGRRVQVGWFQTETRGMPFNQSMSLPLELRLVTTPDGPRVTWTPVAELESLRQKSHASGPTTLREGAANPLANLNGELWELRAAFEPGAASEVALGVRGVPVVFDVAKQELVVNGHRAPAPMSNGKQEVTIFADRTGLEVFASGGRTFVPMPINLKPEDKSLSASVKGGEVKFSRLDAHELKSAWQ